MTVPPPISSRPQAIWTLPGASSAEARREARESWVLRTIRSGLPSGKIEPKALAFLPYRPRLLRQIGPGSLGHPALRTLLFAHPACALELACAHPALIRDLEPAFAGSGESAYRLFAWAARHGGGPPLDGGPLRRALVTDCYWGLRRAHTTGESRLLSEVAQWCGDERHRHAAAAAVFLLHHSREPVAPYRETILSSPFYTYLALPRLSPRGFQAAPQSWNQSPRWACAFALSGHGPSAESLAPAIATDPGWLIELAHARGWLSDADRRRKVEHLLREHSGEHPLFEAALDCLGGTAPAPVRPPTPPPARTDPPAPLTSGQAAEHRALQALRMTKNTEVWRPTREQVDTPAFRQIVGTPRFTQLGQNRGTVIDSVEDGFSEIKFGKSVLTSTYQLRLQTYRALMEDQPLRIYTNRPIEPQFAEWLGPWGVKVEPLPEP